MTLFRFGGGPADWSTTTATISGVDNVARFKASSVLRCWAAREGDNRITDLADATGTPVTEIPVTASSLHPAGHWPEWFGPQPKLYVSVDDGPRVLMVTTDMPELAGQAQAQATQAAQLAQAAAGAAAELAAASSVPAHEERADPHPGYLTTSRGDTRYQRTTVTVGALAVPLEVVTLTTSPAVDASDIRQIWVAGRKTSWLNERGLPRAEQPEEEPWDAPLTLVIARNGTGRALLVQRRDAGSIRRDVGGIDARGRWVTSDQAWTPISTVDPGSTGAYAADTSDEVQTLAIRWDTNDLVRFGGRLSCTGITAGQALLQIPGPFVPLSRRLLAATTLGGDLVPVEAMPDGRLVARRTVPGPAILSVDDLTYVRITGQTGGEVGDGWTLTHAGSATPGTTSPLTITYAGVAGRLYVLVLARSTATDQYTGVTAGANTWTLRTAAPSSGSVGRRIEVWTCQATATFSSVVAAMSGGGIGYASLYEITGHNPSAPVDSAAVTSGIRSASLTPEAYLVTPSGPGRLVLAAVQANNNTTDQITPSAGWTTLPSASGGPKVVYRLDAPVEAQGPAWTLANSVGSGHALVALNPA
ncbi:hypothetical protein [Micromonospora yangpuensis]|uniref:Uncharacterized protein n=1 Tax=Micromonospora yangpuensis TaxID=683228 RepID=A0A1C6VE17_9ACTN|nr:hypothetical protein [Micromonospora yangpuensis]GGM14377.1 hypothetical protein GCM10012279_35600 [Micromonospora yangpuensis]SCL64621.1 hypothetical protein GA0070617_5516 [Micromonospora yangpuensis]